MQPTLEQLQYPIGKFKYPDAVSVADIQDAINAIRSFPFQMMESVKGLSDEQLDTPYRPDGWTIRQVVHHTADSHMNAYIRFKLALTEDNPTIRPYQQALWAELFDSKDNPDVSLSILTGVHKRWVAIMENMSDADWERKLRHPEVERQLTLALFSQQYRWHCMHHLGHITGLKERMGW